PDQCGASASPFDAKTISTIPTTAKPRPIYWTSETRCHSLRKINPISTVDTVIKASTVPAAIASPKRRDTKPKVMNTRGDTTSSAANVHDILLASAAHIELM